MTTVTYHARLPEGATSVLVPAGLPTPHGQVTGITVQGGEAREVYEATTGQTALFITPSGETLTLSFTWDATQRSPYPEAMFTPKPSRFTRYADDLVAEVEEATGHLSGPERTRAIACHTAERFTYGHPEETFNQGMDEVPALGCGLFEGSCVDINTYFLAALRAAGIEAGYVTGFFFPEEKQGTCNDGHCWVVTRQNGETQEWDIAHHLKLGTRDIHPGLNPKPGHRVGCFHSMGLDFPELGVTGIKAMTEPVAAVNGAPVRFKAPEIRSSQPADTQAPAPVS